MKMISLDDAIKAVTMLLDCETDIDKVWSCDVINNLQNAPSVTDVEPTQKWISVKDRLPEEDVDVLAHNGVALFIAAYTTNPSKRWYTISGREIYPTHWMPRPAPPK